ncbi:thioredoxin reductase [Agromyces terreus]|uniref:Thioredoxin reductase n=1 Tax=Agromyces terreus TaxID=424795 RepID=A0A9X2GV91_9MICO|nr:NAD(P)/FAD-dependent oxidoreductase [Agromyces terreus]MCP2369630.1 thioredoxin reductase [Agromyces terreus]
MQQNSWDVIIVGGGSAGLSAALMLGRSRRRVLVVDARRPRNRFAGHMHGVIGRDHTSPLDLLADARVELARYDGVEVREGAVAAASVDRDDDATGDGPRLLVELDDGTRHAARRLLVASGVQDVLPDIAGLAEQWGRGAFLCPYCDGWEHRDRRIGVLATGAGSMHQAQLMRQLSAHVRVFAEGAQLTAADRAGLLARDIPLEQRRVVAILADADGRLTGVRLDDGDELDVDALFVAPEQVPDDGLLRALGAVRAPHPMGGEFTAVDPMGRTSVPGVWAAGNVTDPRSSVPFAMAAGNAAGAAINADLVAAEVAAAVAATAAGTRRSATAPV